MFIDVSFSSREATYPLLFGTFEDDDFPWDMLVKLSGTSPRKRDSLEAENLSCKTSSKDLLFGVQNVSFLECTLPETNIFAPENGWLEYDRFLFGMAYFQGRTVSFRECIFTSSMAVSGSPKRWLVGII